MKTVDALKGAGKEAYLVGGCVRDLLLGVKPKDYDVTTNAGPIEVMAIMANHDLKTIPTGLQHGTVTVLDPEYGHVEVTTYRVDGEYTDGRRPDTVEFTRNIYEDLARRDFTFNAMALDPDTNDLLDPYEGRKDLHDEVIRAVGDPMRRFYEDPLRMFRAARFAATLGFGIENGTWDAMAKMSLVHEDRIQALSVERIRDEMMKALRGDNVIGFFTHLEGTGLLGFVLPELEALRGIKQPKKYHAYDADEHSRETLVAMCDMTHDPILRFTALVHDIGKAKTQGFKGDGTPTFHEHEDVGAVMVREVMMRLKFSNSEIERVTNLVNHHLVPYTQSWSHAAVRRFVQKVGRENMHDLLMLRRADLVAHGLAESDNVQRTDNILHKLEDLKDLEDRINMLESRSELVLHLDVNGNDLIQLGIKPGPKMGEVLRALREIVTMDPSQNVKEKLLAYAAEMM